MSRIPIDDENEMNEADPAEASTDSTSAAEATAPDGDYEKLRAERDDLFNRLARLSADFKNTQRRLQAEMDQRMQYANSTLIKSVLPVIDNFERALGVDASKTDPATILKGMQIVHDQLLSVLKSQHVEEIAPKPGEPFDPSKHEALMQQDAPQYDEPTVVQLLQKGYALHDRTLRPAQVAVSKSQ